MRNKDELSDFERGMVGAGENIQWSAARWGMCLVYGRGQRLVLADIEAIVTQIATRCNRDLHKGMSEHTTHRSLKQIDPRNP